MRARTLVVAGALGGLAALNTRLERSGGELSNRLGGETRYYRWRGKDLAYTVTGEGEPLLLVHGIYAGASSFEFRKNFGELSRDFRVYALDLLGCGLSERPRRRYGPEDVTSQVEDFVREEIGGAAHLVASTLCGALIDGLTGALHELGSELVGGERNFAASFGVLHIARMALPVFHSNRNAGRAARGIAAFEISIQSHLHLFGKA